MAELPTTRSQKLLSVEGLSKAYTRRRGFLGLQKQLVLALSGVSFSLERGETLGVVGESGSGKSTLGRAILRLVEPTFGRVQFDGVDVLRLGDRDLSKLRRRMQVVFQDPTSSLNPKMTGMEVVAEGLLSFGLSSKAALQERVRAMIERVGLPADVLARYPHELSGGQRQRLAIARALVVEPDFVVCDEPVSSLDVSVQAQIVNLLERMQESSNVALLFISHDLQLVAQTAHRVLVLYAGRAVEIGPAAALSENALHPYSRALFAASPAPAALAGRNKRRLVLAGEPPSPLATPPGCPFHPRCERAEPGLCDKETPALEPSTDDARHLVACFYPG